MLKFDVRLSRRMRNSAIIAIIIFCLVGGPTHVRSRTESGNSASLDFCQNSKNKLLFIDGRLKPGSGILHKFNDFLKAVEVAVKSDRILVDFIPKLNPRLGFIALYGPLEKYYSEKEVITPWKFGNFFNLSQLTFSIKYSNVRFLEKLFSLEQALGFFFRDQGKNVG